MSDNEIAREDNAAARKVMSLPVVLFLIFLVLKLTGVITWSWLWVFAPLWVSFGLFLIAIGISLIVAMIVSEVRN